MAGTEKKPHERSAQDAGEKAEQIASEASDVSGRVRELVVEFVEDRGFSQEKLQDVASNVMEGAVEGVSSLKPDQRESVLREVIDGLSQGFQVAANATRLAFEETHSRGRAFAKEDIDRTISDLRTLNSMFVNTVTSTLERTGNEAVEQTKGLYEHAKRTGSAMQPSIQSAIDAAMRDPINLAKESAKAGVAGTRLAAGMLLQSMSGFLQGAADVVTGSAGRSSESDDASSASDESNKQTDDRKSGNDAGAS